MVQSRLHAGLAPKHAAVAFRLAADGRRRLVVVAAESVEVDRRVEARWQVDGWVAPNERILDGGGLSGRVGRPRARVALEGAPDGWRLSWSAGSAAAIWSASNSAASTAAGVRGATQLAPPDSNDSGVGSAGTSVATHAGRPAQPGGSALPPPCTSADAARKDITIGR